LPSGSRTLAILSLQGHVFRFAQDDGPADVEALDRGLEVVDKAIRGTRLESGDLELVDQG
jgi:hypothetical protein